LASALECDSDTFRHEVKGGSTIHDKRCASVVGQHEYGYVIHRIFAPPTPPGLVRPRPRMGPNMVLPRIQVPMLWKPRAAKSSSMPVSPPSFPNRCC
jgi:hypothetical protein